MYAINAFFWLFSASGLTMLSVNKSFRISESYKEIQNQEDTSKIKFEKISDKVAWSF